MESTAARRPPANDEGVCGMFINLFRRQRPALARLARQNGIESATGPAGTLVLFDCNTMHGSAGNISPFPRNNVFFVYNSLENALTEPFGADKPRPDFLGDRDAPPVGRL